MGVSLSRNGWLGLAALAAVAFLAPVGSAWAESFAKVQPMVLEIWDKRGVFHFVTIDLVAVSEKGGRVTRGSVIKIQTALQSLPYEELTKPESSDYVKQTALDIVKQQPGGETIDELLISRFLFH